MSLSVAETTELSDPFVFDLIQNGAVDSFQNVSVADIIGNLDADNPLTDPSGEAARLFVIAGGAAGGKSTLAEDVAGHFTKRGAAPTILSADNYVRGSRKERQQLEALGMIGPEDKYDFRALRAAVGAICLGNTVELPVYDVESGQAIDGGSRRVVSGINVLIAEGDMLGEQGKAPQDLYPARAYKPLTIYTHVPDQLRLERRVKRDLIERNGQGANEEHIVTSFGRRQRTQHEPYTLTYAAHADVILTPPVNSRHRANGRERKLYDMHVMQTVA